jgi:2-polyprenyl-3-methyl-5-hydroxy-6-metoxy-1,4-benzoquinol methylase
LTRSWTTPDPVPVRVAGFLEPGQALDVGCGGGHDSLWLARNGWSVTAIDISRHAVATVRKLAREKGLDVSAKRVDVTALDAEGEYDLVSICYMHLPKGDRALMLGNAARSLRPGGTLLFRSFEAGIREAPFPRELLPRRSEVVRELSSLLVVQQADVADEFFPYMNKVMRLLTVVAKRET